MADDPLIEGQLTESVIGAFYEVYNTLGFRYLEQVYMAALERELRARGHLVGREVWVPVFYKGEVISRQRIDIIVDGKLVVEVKSTHELHKFIDRRQRMATAVGGDGTGQISIQMQIEGAWDMALRVSLHAIFWIAQRKPRIEHDDVGRPRFMQELHQRRRVDERGKSVWLLHRIATDFVVA